MRRCRQCGRERCPYARHSRLDWPLVQERRPIAGDLVRAAVGAVALGLFAVAVAGSLR